MSIVVCVRPIVGTTQRFLPGEERSVPIVPGTERRVPAVDRYTMTSGRWYRTHAERGKKGDR
jgi:hypothetical protein